MLPARPAEFKHERNLTFSKTPLPKELAHLFPDARECHKAYGFLAQSTTGKTVGGPVEHLKLLNVTLWPDKYTERLPQ